MPVTLHSLHDLDQLGFDEVIDVRSPSEYVEDHVPDAISLPVLSDEERAIVGTIYVQENPFKARKIGAALVSRNAARHLETVLADKPKSYRPLVYCWRGGQRSGSFAVILQQIGWKADTIDGGYRAYRRLVQKALYDDPWPCPVVVLEGNTGTAKTELLPLVAEDGLQVLDLEGLANHRGSLFGSMDGGQPHQKTFESRLAMAMARLDPTRPVLVEGESSKIGNINIPPSLWDAMKAAPRVVIDAPLTARADYLARAYADVTADQGRLLDTLTRLEHLHARDRIEAWRNMAQSGAFTDLAAALMAEHYDPRYAKQRARFDDCRQTQIALDDLTPETLRDAAPLIKSSAVELISK